MIFGRIGTLIKKIKEAFGECFKDIDEQIDKTVENISGIRDDLGKVSDKLDKVNGGLQGEFDTFKTAIYSRFDTADGKLTELNANIGKFISEQAVEIENLRAEVAEVDVLRKTIDDKDNQISELDATLKSKENHYRNLEKELQDMDSKLTAAQDELKSESQKSDTIKAELQTWKDAVACYEPVRDAMRNCDTFRNFLEARNLTDNSDIGLLAFAQEIGKAIYFLSDVHETAVKIKKAQGDKAELMTKEELAVYVALNKCYRRLMNIDFDVFVTPGEKKSVSDNFDKIPFNKDDAEVLLKPNSRSLLFVKGIYVPLLLNEKGSMYRKAQVEASNI